MSTILDALRKSEQERKLNKLPTLVDMAAPQEPARWPLLIAVVLAMLAIAVVALAYAIWSSKPEAIQAQASQNIIIVAKPAIGTVDGPSLADASISATDFGVSEGLSLVDGIAVAEVVAEVNAVSYSEDPTLRFAMVNGKMVREGEFVAPGLRVEQILFDAVVFNERGVKVTRGP